MPTNPLIITCPVVGAELSKEDYPHLPTTPEEIAESARGAVEAGASIIHLHVRDERGKPSQRVDIFGEVTEKIRHRCECIIQYSTGGAVGPGSVIASRRASRGACCRCSRSVSTAAAENAFASVSVR